MYNNTKSHKYLNLQKKRKALSQNYFKDKTFDQTSLKKQPKKILRTYMFNMGREGIRYSREVEQAVMALSLVGGFVTSIFYGVFFAYKFLTEPFTELKLAHTFDRIKHSIDEDHCNAEEHHNCRMKEMKRWKFKF